MITATRRDFETDLLDAAGRVFAPIPPPRIAEVQHDYDRTRLALVAYADEAEARAAVAELQPARLRDQPICRVNSFGRALRSRTGRTTWRPASSSGWSSMWTMWCWPRTFSRPPPPSSRR